MAVGAALPGAGALPMVPTVATSLLALLAAGAVTRRYPLERVRRAVGEG